MYRVDRRVFNISDIITAPEVPYQDHEGFDQTVENILSQRKPANKIANRRTGLFIFLELSDAIRFSCLMTNSKIYKVEPHNTQIFHKGDMNWTEVMYRMDKTNEHAINQIGDFYWTAGCKTFKPCWEILVNQMRVSAIISGTENTRKSFCMQFKTDANLNIENVDFYRQAINE